MSHIQSISILCTQEKLACKTRSISNSFKFMLGKMLFGLTLTFTLVSLALKCDATQHGGHHDHATTALSSRYPFYVLLSDEPAYELHWRVDLEQEIIQFAVNVSTTNWVGFGLSPNGQMSGSDVIIGWIGDDGVERFTVRMF